GRQRCGPQTEVQNGCIQTSRSSPAGGGCVGPRGPRSAKRNPFSAVPVSGTSADGNVFQGTMDVLGFVNDNGVVKAIGSLTGTITPATGAAQQVAGAIVLVPVKTPQAEAQQGFGGMDSGSTRLLRSDTPSAQAQASCPILNL